MMINKRVLSVGCRLSSVLAIICVMATGCVGYRLGTTLPAGIQSLHVPTFVNNTKEPLLEVMSTSTTIQEFQRDGTLKIVGVNQADTILKVTLLSYKLEPLAFDRDQSRQTKEYRLVIIANIEFSKTSGELLTRSKVQGEATFMPRGDLSSAKRTALPQASKDLAHRIVESVVEYW